MLTTITINKMKANNAEYLNTHIINALIIISQINKTIAHM